MPKKRSHGEGALYYIKSKNLWRGVVQLDPDPITGKRRPKEVTARTQRACKAKLDALKDEIREHGSPLDKTTKVADWSRQWLDIYARPKLDPKTFTNYSSLIRKWIVPTLGQKRVSALLPSDVMAVRRRMIDAGRSPGTAKQVNVVLSAMLEQARREKLCRTNVVKDLDAVAYKPADRAEIPTEAILKLLALAARKKDGSRWWFKILTGQRQGEILGAVIEDRVDGYYTVNWKLEMLTYGHSCGTRSGERWPCGYIRGHSCPDRAFIVPDNFRKRHLVDNLFLTEPKSQTGKRVPLVPALDKAIDRYLDAMANKPNPHGLIWRHDDGTPISSIEDRQAWHELLHEAGLITDAELASGKTSLTGHLARHTVVTALAALGVDMQLIGEIVGQSDEKVTRLYRHVRDDERMEAMNKLAETWLPSLELES